MPPRVSFIVPVRNDAVRLERCLRSIRAAHDFSDGPGRADLTVGRYVQHAPEIVVVDNGSTDRSPDVARSLGARVLVIEQVRVSELRNRGAAAATGEILAFVDADHEIGAGWIAAIVDNLQVEGVGATGALYLAPPNGTWVQRGYGRLRGATGTRHDVEWLGSGNLAMPRPVFQAIGGFDTSLEACEDVDLCNRIRAAGYRIVGDPRIESVHHGDPRTLGELFRSERWRGRNNLRVSFRRPLNWRSMPSAMLPIIDVVLLALAGVGVGGRLAGWEPGTQVAIGAVAVVAAGALLRVARATPRTPAVRAASFMHTFVVAAVYDIARACALVTRAPHRNVEPGTAARTASS